MRSTTIKITRTKGCFFHFHQKLVKIKESGLQIHFHILVEWKILDFKFRLIIIWAVQKHIEQIVNEVFILSVIVVVIVHVPPYMWKLFFNFWSYIKCAKGKWHFSVTEYFNSNIFSYRLPYIDLCLKMKCVCLVFSSIVITIVLSCRLTCLHSGFLHQKSSIIH